MHERHYRKIVAILEERHKRRYVWVAHVLLFAVAFVMFNFNIQPVIYFWLGLIVLHLGYVVVKDVRGRMLKRQIEARYSWDSLDDEVAGVDAKRKRLYLEEDGELIDFELPDGDKLKRDY